MPEDLHQTTWCTEMALRFIAERREAPWLMSLNPFDPHPPCDPPQEYLDRYNPQAMPWPLFREEDIERQKAFRAIDQQTAEAVNPMLFDESKAAYGADLDSQDKASNPPASYDARKLKAAYYAQIELIDTQFGRILDALKASGQWENTIVIFTSDHGEMLGDHGLLYKGCRFFEGLTHVPLIVSWPGRFRAGLRSEALVELVDLAPTLLEAAGLPAPPTMQGKSLLPILEGRADPGFHKPHVVSEYNDALGMAQGRAPGSKSDHSHGSMVFDGRYKTCVYHGHGVGEIYDLQTDPGEFRNLWFEPEHRELKSELLLRHLDAMMATSDAGIPRTAHF
ncbi:MAG: Arylsulfatase [candidate division BRC1 bacterium ADurb.BinA364]|nr:MAG: Arylsulfatase [candidate division BRC1 bacterium ADurb.BinA364]